ncbi:MULTISPECIES: LysR family transcriptional regulator [unclassified Streptomyces]|uniref:LysR family transcriptional regulator n=1 Tax=unclassified Streptomyces TaxID=2593676 RepID=UPI002DD844C4|nr:MULTISPECIES: LysR family transcriptional regulator [unclassified Streptomyces]WSA90122.1 LysR family transcriptional regulator [Streptomyces sp. NBC_01795]WSB74353.1 LysR family transcriptional regulator [Streptomyces sp. NBC_01775]WSS17266.1 LysR family transcriptional regulator [Streptomyces sp. NBC_01186]WSS46008.1 LysR family transcriptional regulator [Streptomyces sp. NBC_01187]
MRGITMELRQLRHFLAVAETLNFRTAAERLHMTQPPLSVSIRKLEDEIGAKLFLRSTHSVELTSAGEAALEHARAVVFHSTELARVAESTAAGATGNLRVGFVGSAKNRLLPLLLPAFSRTYPGVALKFTEDTNTGLIDSLERHTLDVCIVRVPLTRRSDLQYVTVEADRFVLALPTGHRFTRQKRITLNDLSDEPFIDYTQHAIPGLHALSTMLFQEAGVTPKVAQEAVQVETVLFLVGSGMGVALVPSSAARKGRDGVEFRELITSGPQPPLGLAVAWNPRYQSQAGLRFRELAEEVGVSPPGP